MGPQGKPVETNSVMLEDRNGNDMALLRRWERLMNLPRGAATRGILPEMRREVAEYIDSLREKEEAMADYYRQTWANPTTALNQARPRIHLELDGADPDQLECGMP